MFNVLFIFNVPVYAQSLKESIVTIRDCKFLSKYIEANPIYFFIDNKHDATAPYIRDAAVLWTEKAKIPKWIEVTDKEKANVLFLTVNSPNIDFTGKVEFENESPGGKNKGTIQLNLYRLGNQENSMRTIIHEMGHALGLAHNDDDPTSVMVSNRQLMKSYIPNITDVRCVRERYRGL